MTEAIPVSICIPAYKRSDYLKRLLDSIRIQTFRNFEVIVTDDSPDDSVKDLCQQYQNAFLLNYHRNPVTLGTPANWNEAINKANGRWIKLMHDDDWFADENSLQQFVNAIDQNSSASFIFSAYKNVYLESGRTENVFAVPSRFRMLQKNPQTLLSGNIIGPPSVVMHKKNHSIQYDDRLKWLVDIDFYMRCLASGQPYYINNALVNIGVGEKQVTQTAFGNKTVEVPEYFLLLQKTGVGALRNIMVFDAWWRFIRNMNIRSKENISQSGYQGPIPDVILDIVNFQNKIPVKILKIGPISKSFMLMSYLSVKKKLV